MPWSGAYVDSRGDPTCDLCSNIAAESSAKIVYERLIAITDDPGIKDALGFLMTREIAHQKSFEKALNAIEENFPPGKLAGETQYANLYVNASQGQGDMLGPWNSGPEWNRIDDIAAAFPVDGGDGKASVDLGGTETDAVIAMSKRTQSKANGDAATPRPDADD